jgi:hypothetical protein
LRFLSHLFISLLVGVLEDHQAFFGVLEFLGEVVGFALETLGFTFVDVSLAELGAVETLCLH